jgi:secreted trypsin-like serine protease
VALKRIRIDELLCGGAIITHIHILTTAHCVDGFANVQDNIKIIVGSTNSSSFTGITFYPSRIFIHDGYTGNLNPLNTIENDIAILKVY